MTLETCSHLVSLGKASSAHHSSFLLQGLKDLVLLKDVPGLNVSIPEMDSLEIQILDIATHSVYNEPRVLLGVSLGCAGPS